MARDVVHAVVVQVHGLDSIASFDRDFDKIKGLRRIELQTFSGQRSTAPVSTLALWAARAWRTSPRLSRH
jgi:hypothetical protein